MIIDPVIIVFILNEEISNLRNIHHLTITFGIQCFCLGSFNTSHVDSLDLFGTVVI